MLLERYEAIAQHLGQRSSRIGKIDIFTIDFSSHPRTESVFLKRLDRLTSVVGIHQRSFGYEWHKVTSIGHGIYAYLLLIMELSVIIATYNRREIILKLLEEMLLVCQECEVIVVDDGSIDGTSDAIAKCYPQVKHILHQSNMGTPKSWNDGIDAATRKVVLLLPDDIHLKFGLEGLKQLSEIAQDKIVGLRVIQGEKSRSKMSFNHRKLSKLIYWLSGQVFPPSDDKAGFVDFVSGVMAFPRDIPIRFDENFKGTAFREETDFQLRARIAGYRIFYLPELAIEHDDAVTGGISAKEQLNLKNHEYFLRKNYGFWWWPKMRFYRLYSALKGVLI